MQTIDDVYAQLEAEEAVGEFEAVLMGMAATVAKNAELKGFHNVGLTKGDRIALMHSELSEVLEAVRAGDPPSEKCPGISNEVEELADLIIRVLDYAYCYSLPLGHAIVQKAKYNTKRPFMHGKTM